MGLPPSLVHLRFTSVPCRGHPGFLFWEGSRAGSPFGTPSWLKATQSTHRPRACPRGSPSSGGIFFPPHPRPLAFPDLGRAGGWGRKDTRPLSAPASPPDKGPAWRQKPGRVHGGPSSFHPSPENPLPSAAGPRLSGGGRQTQNHQRWSAARPARRGLTGLRPLWADVGLSGPGLGLTIRNGQAA